MKYVCLGYSEEAMWERLPPAEIDAIVAECVAYDDELKRGGHYVRGEALQVSRNAATLRWQGGKVTVTDGPFAETKEQIGGLLVLEARDLNHAIQLMSKHPGVRAGPFEIRPAADLAGMIRDSEQRRARK